MPENKVKRKYPWTIDIFGLQVMWPFVLFHGLEHIVAIYGFYSFVIGSNLWQTVVYTAYMIYLSNIGLTVAAHRYFAHRSFKANLPLRILLAVLHTFSGQFSIHNWVRDHKMHHKFSDTDADPHNSNRGFLFCHFGWLLLRKHPDVIEKARQLGIEETCDALSDPVVQFQRKYYIPLAIMTYGVIPTAIPCYLWNETLLLSFSANILRHVISLHETCLINSAAHLWGYRPYDRNTNPVESKLVMYAMVGEGYHNYHHAFAWDYSISEHSWQKNFNPGTLFIDFFALIGWAYDRKKVSPEMIEKRRIRTGDINILIQRNNVIFDWIIGMIVQTWIIWFPFLIRVVINSYKYSFYTSYFIFLPNFLALSLF